MKNAEATTKRGSHGCFTHVEMWGSSVANLNHPRKCSRHHATRPAYERTLATVGPMGTLVPTGECGRCGATVERTADGNNLREVWTLR